METLSQDQKNAVQAVAKEAVKLVQSGMTIGLGTGRAATAFIAHLLKKIESERLKVKCVATSLRSKILVNGGLDLIDESLPSAIDITFDGADRADPTHLFLIKGGGGALLREKLVAAKSKINITLIDETKLVHPLQGFPLPVEIVEFGYKSTLERIEALGFKGKLRIDEKRALVKSDNGNLIFDIDLEKPLNHPLEVHSRLKATLGVIETGLFLETTTKIYVGKSNGTVTILEKK